MKLTEKRFGDVWLSYPILIHEEQFVFKIDLTKVKDDVKISFKLNY